MTTTATHAQTAAADAFGRRVAARLSTGAGALPYDVTERLRAARMQAVAVRKREAVALPRLAAAGVGNVGDDGLGFWGRIASALPLVALVAGLVLIHGAQNDKRASELAEVDVLLLTDDLPPAAYADPGFAQFLKTGQE
jgi:hypothetical protein